ncbi:hypothetical protein ACIGB8_17585 [Promicromonospora sukumoe]|uniref:hypothetical protein n=1 Tax=Promicromonospora sukumoe TaxID=88382 RepID=UPI0037C7A069
MTVAQASTHWLEFRTGVLARYHSASPTEGRASGRICARRLPIASPSTCSGSAAGVNIEDRGRIRSRLEFEDGLFFRFFETGMTRGQEQPLTLSRGDSEVASPQGTRNCRRTPRHDGDAMQITEGLGHDVEVNFDHLRMQLVGGPRDHPAVAGQVEPGGPDASAIGAIQGELAHHLPQPVQHLVDVVYADGGL